MAFGLDDALIGWLVASAGDSMLSVLRTDPTARALGQVVDDAVDRAVASVSEHLDGEQSEHLRQLLREHDLQLSGVTVSSVNDLRTAVRGWAAALDCGEFGEPGYLAGLGIDSNSLGDALAHQIAEGIREGGRTGGPLGRLADWLWRTDLSGDVLEIKESLSHLRNVVEPSTSYRGGLPGVTPDFTGRQHAIDELAQRVRAHDPTGVVATICAVDGMAGVGKTELALRVAHNHKHSYVDGQYFIDLHGYSEGLAPMTPSAALEELLRQAGVSPQLIPADLAGRMARWQGFMADRRALVLLDNVLDAQQVRPLLPRAAGCLVLITSRSVLRELPGVRTLALDVLPDDEAIDLFTRIAGPDAHLDRQAVAAAVELVSKLPVAVRVAASQVGDDYSTTELVGDLSRAKEHADLVAAAGPLGSEVEAAFDTSLRQLDTHRQRAYGILGTHPGPTVGVPQFAALAGISVMEASATLRELSRRNLISPVPGVGHRHYQQHDLLREHARRHAITHLSADERSAALERLTEWYVLAAKYVDHVSPQIRATRGSGPVVDGLDLGGGLDAGEWVRGEENNLLALADHASDRTTDVCNLYGSRLGLLNKRESATALYAAAERLYRATSTQAGEARALCASAAIAWLRFDLPARHEHLSAARDIFHRVGDRQGEADTLVDLAWIDIETSSYGGAHEYLLSALSLYRQAGNQQGEDEVLDAMGVADELFADMGAYALLGGFDRANTLLSLGKAALGPVDSSTDSSSASENFRKALAIAQETGNRLPIEAEALAGLGRAAIIAHEHAAAEAHLRAALHLHRRIGDRYGEADDLDGLGDAATATGHHERARDLWREALAIYMEVDSYLVGRVQAKLEPHRPR